MPSPRQYNSLVVVIDRQLFDHLSATKMKIGKAPAVLKKAAAMCKSKTGVFTTSLLVLASLRRRMAMVGAISHRIHALIVAEKGAKVDYHKALTLHNVKKPTYHGGEKVDPSHNFPSFDQEADVPWLVAALTGHCCNGLCYSYSYSDEYDSDDDDEDEPSVMNALRNNQEAEALEFSMEDDIDQAAEMFIRRFREQMNESFS